MKLFKQRVRLDIAKYSFGNKVCDQWIKLAAVFITKHKYIQRNVRKIHSRGIWEGFKYVNNRCPEKLQVGVARERSSSPTVQRNQVNRVNIVTVIQNSCF